MNRMRTAANYWSLLHSQQSVLNNDLCGHFGTSGVARIGCVKIVDCDCSANVKVLQDPRVEC